MIKIIIIIIIIMIITMIIIMIVKIIRKDWNYIKHHFFKRFWANGVKKGIFEF